MVIIQTDDGEVVAYTLKEVANMLHKTHRTIWNWRRAGKLKAVKVGGSWMVRQEEVTRLLTPEDILGTRDDI